MHLIVSCFCHFCFLLTITKEPKTQTAQAFPQLCLKQWWKTKILKLRKYYTAAERLAVTLTCPCTFCEIEQKYYK